MSETALEATKKPTKKALELAYQAILGDADLPVVSDPEVVSRAIAERIMAAESFDEAFKPQELEGWREYLDVPVQVKDFHLNRTNFEGGQGAPVYAVVDILELESGEIRTVTCGGRNVLMQLVKMLEKGWLDNPVKLIGKPTAEGYQALWLVAA